MIHISHHRFLTFLIVISSTSNAQWLLGLIKHGHGDQDLPLQILLLVIQLLLLPLLQHVRHRIGNLRTVVIGRLHLLGLGIQLAFLLIQTVSLLFMIDLWQLQLLDCLLLLCYLFLELWNLVYDLVQFLLRLQKLSPDLAWTYLSVQQLLVLLLNFFHVLLVLDLQLVEVDEL